MQIVFFLFFIGTLSLFLFKQVPTSNEISLLLLASIAALMIKNKIIRYLGVIGLGCFWVLLHAKHNLSYTLLPQDENHAIFVTGTISSIPINNISYVEFDFDVNKIGNKTWPTRIHLKWRNNQYTPHVGESWRFLVKLKRPHSLMNPGGIDSERVLFLKNIRAVGTILPSNCNHMLFITQKYPIERAREFLLHRLFAACPINEFRGIIVALILGMTHLISSEQWQVFRETGTNHLVAISGLHIGLIALISAKIAKLLWCRFPNAPLLWPTPYVSRVCGLIFACCYSLLAGMSASTFRALLMIFFITLATLLKRQVTTLQALIFSLGILLLLQPLAVLSVGFWLSFLAVFLLINAFFGRLAPTGLWWQWGRAQWAIGFGMLPTLICLFQQVSLLSFPANLIAIPWFSFLVVPSCLLAAVVTLFCRPVATGLFDGVTGLIKILWYFLEQLVRVGDIVIWHQSFGSLLQMLCAHITTLFALIPQGIITRIISLLLFSTCFNHPELPNNALKISVLDVGQGLAVLVQTAKHNLVFDTGSKINENYDMGMAVIIPYLKHLGIQKIDVLTISHGDNDHIGGANFILKTMPVSHIITSVPARFKGLAPITCRENLAWQWEGVTFKFLSPPLHSTFIKNNSSCVLKISSGKHGILLTGDIEKAAEDELTMRHRKELASTILVAPHHGSKTSSSANFIKATAPKYVIFSCGYKNVFHHPHAAVIERYRQSKCQLLSTVTSGAITMTLFKDSDKVIVQNYREKYQKLWH